METATGEAIDLVSLEASSVVVGPLIVTKLEVDFAAGRGKNQFRIALPEGAAVLEWDVPGFCRNDMPASLVSGTWTKPLESGETHLGLIYAQPLDHGRVVVVNSSGHPRLFRVGATLADEEGRELAEPLVLSDAEASGEIVAQVEVEGEAFRAGDLAMIRANPGVERTSVPISDAVVAIDTSASSAMDFARRIEQAKGLAQATRGKLALVAFDQSADTRFSGESKDLRNPEFEALARRGALGATNLEVAFKAIEGLLRRHEFRRVILLTDGVATAGTRDGAKLASLAARWARLGVRRLDVVAPNVGRNQALLEGLVAKALPEHGRVASSNDDFEREFAQPSVPDVPVAIGRAIAQRPWTFVAPLTHDERWVLARVPEGLPLSMRVGERSPRTVSAEPAWRPLFERYFEQQGGLFMRAAAAKRDTLVLEHGKLSNLRNRHRPIVRCDFGVMVSGRLPPESIQRVVRLNFPRFRGCAVQNHQPPIVPKGRVTVRFTIDPEGHVTQVQDWGSTVPSRSFVRCVLQTFTAMSFTSPSEGRITVVYPLVFGDVDPDDNSEIDSSRSYSDDIPTNYVPVTLDDADYAPLLPRDVGTEAYEGAFGTVMQALADKRLEDAEDTARTYLKRHPRELLANLAWGRASEARGNLAEARRAYGSLIDLFPNDVSALRVAAAWLSHLGDRPSRAIAIGALKTAIVLKADRASTERELAWLLVQEGAYEAALDQLTAAFFHLGESGPTLLNQEIAIVASTLLAQHPERSSAVFEQLRRSGTRLASKSELIIAIQNETKRELALSIYANPEKGRFSGTSYADRVHTAYEISAAERRTPYTIRVHHGRENRYRDYRDEPRTGFGSVRILDYDGKGHLHVELRPFVLQLEGSEVDLSNYG